MPNIYNLEDEESRKSPLINNKIYNSNIANANPVMSSINPNKPKKKYHIIIQNSLPQQQIHVPNVMIN